MTWKRIADQLKRNKEELVRLCGVLVDERRLVDIARRINRILDIPQSDESVGATYQSCQHLLGEKTDIVLIRETVRKISANRSYVERGRPIPLWDGSPVQTTLGVKSLPMYA